MNAYVFEVQFSYLALLKCLLWHWESCMPQKHSKICCYEGIIIP